MAEREAHDEGQTGSNREHFEERVRAAQIEARARNISHNVRCLECGHQAIEESQAEIAIKLRKVIRDELRKGKTDKDIYNKLTTEYGETILYSPAFDAQSAVLWLLPGLQGSCLLGCTVAAMFWTICAKYFKVMTVGAIAGMTFYRGRRRQSGEVEALTKALLRGIPLSPAEHQTLSKIVELPTPIRQRSSLSKWF